MNRKVFVPLIGLLYLCACSTSAGEDRSTHSDGNGMASSARTAPDGEGGEPRAPASMDPRVRRFAFTYEATVPAIPAGTKELRVWMPAPRKDPGTQEVVECRAEVVGHPGIRLELREDAAKGNRWWFAAIPQPMGPLTLRQTMTIVRTELLNNDFRRVGGEPIPASMRESFREELGPYELVPVGGRIEGLAATVAPEEKNLLNVARAVYDHVLGRMTYSKQGTGWGRGDTLWACDAGFGNCTDFHSLFMSLAKARGIPTRFHIGFPLPESRGEQSVGGYHCWAEFFLPERGWIPVDISEADKHPDLAQYYFGALTEDRVDFFVGRDLMLDPKPAKGKLNFFIYPLVEADGQELTVEKSFAVKDLGT